MIEDIVKNYKKKCTPLGQFGLIFDTAFAMFVIFSVGSILDFYLYKLLNKHFHELLLLYFLIFILGLVEFVYIVLMKVYAFRRMKKDILRIISELIDKENNKRVKVNAKKKLEYISKINFDYRKLTKVTSLEKLYNIIKFDEFIDDSRIKNKEKAKEVKSEIKDYLQDKDNFKNLIDVAFWGLIVTAVINPIIEYVQGVFIPNTSNVFDSFNVLVYLIVVVSLISPVFILNYAIRKVNDSNNQKEKKVLLRIQKSLDEYDFDNDINRLEKYLKIDFDNKK